MHVRGKSNRETEHEKRGINAVCFQNTAWKKRHTNSLFTFTKYLFHQNLLTLRNILFLKNVLDSKTGSL